MKCIECNQRCNPILNTSVSKILLEITKLPLELCEKVEFYYNYSISCSICCNILCYKHYNGYCETLCNDCLYNEFM